jgi:hypothetical protein
VTDNENANTAYNLEDSLAPALGLGRNNVIHIFAVQSYCAMTAGMYKQGMPIYMRTRDRLVAARPVFEKEPYSQFIYMLPVMALVRLGKWDEIMQAPMPDHQWKYATILAHFARGMANVHHNDLRAAIADLESLPNVAASPPGSSGEKFFLRKTSRTRQSIRSPGQWKKRMR